MCLDVHMKAVASLLLELQCLCPQHLISCSLSAQDLGKLRVLSAILTQLPVHHHREKIVLISNYTQMPYGHGVCMYTVSFEHI